MKLSKKWVRNWARRTVAGMVAGSLCMISPGLAKMEEKQEYNFDPILVTAKRQESTDLKTAASVQVINEQQLKATGASNLLEALKFSTGITYDGYARRGGLYGSMSGGLAIRGMRDRGTLVMINGVPTNLNGDYALEHIPPDNIERVEVIKGASSTLYGSAALSGVINIITKKTVKNSASIETGSYGYNRQAVSVQAGDFSITAARQTDGDSGQWNEPASGKYTAFRGDTREFFRWSWKISDKISFTHQYDKDDYRVDRVNYPAQTIYETVGVIDVKHSMSLQMQNGLLQSKLYYNGLQRDYTKPYTSYTKNSSSDKNDMSYQQTFGIDNQVAWKTKFGDYVAGMSWQKETFRVDERRLGPFTTAKKSNTVPLKQRDYLSFFGQLTHPFSPQTQMILGLRQEFIQQQGGLNNYSEFNPQIQFLYTPTKEQSWYVNAGRAFRMPNYSAMYSSSTLTIGNPDLEPESGYTYEFGWKKIGKSDSLKVALYHMIYSNYTSWKNIGGTYTPYNAEFRNTGLEIEYAKSLKNGWSYNLGASFSNPENKEPGTEWTLYSAKTQLTAGLSYKRGKWQGSIAANYLDGRQTSTANPTGIPAALLANLTLGYDLTPRTHLKLRVENLFDRRDIVSNGSSAYYAQERSFYLGITQDF
jgi:iron complex outermembrane receptor protein